MGIGLACVLELVGKGLVSCPWSPAFQSESELPLPFWEVTEQNGPIPGPGTTRSLQDVVEASAHALQDFLMPRVTLSTRWLQLLLEAS